MVEDDKKQQVIELTPEPMQPFCELIEEEEEEEDEQMREELRKHILHGMTMIHPMVHKR